MGQSVPDRSEAAAALAAAARLDAEGRHGPALDALGQAANKGSAEAATALGVRLLTADRAPLSAREGVRALTRARALGGAEAPAILAVLAGMGAGIPQSWPQALDLLVEAAARGSASARAQLRLLAAGPLADRPAEGSDWAALAAGADIAAWTAPAPKTPLCQAPRIRALPGFISAAVCDWLIAAGGARIVPATVYDAETGGSRREDARSNSAFEFALADLDLVTVLLRARIAAAAGVPVGALEPPQLLHYTIGQKFDPHYDFLDVAEPGYARDVAARGQRAATFLLYLNTGFEGGETTFPKLGLSFKGQPGDALMFANVEISGDLDLRTLHAGAPPTSGEKWLFSQWIRDRIPAAAD